MNNLFQIKKKNIKDEIYKYISNLSNIKKLKIIKNLKKIKDYNNDTIPIPIKIIQLPLSISQKNNILETYTTLVKTNNSEQKLKKWFDSLLLIPFGKYYGINFELFKNNNEIQKFLSNLNNIMDNVVYGHNDAKKQIIQIMGQQIKNPKAKGNIIGLWGPPGNGKCFALNTPILMYNGTIKKVQDIKIGDIIMGDDSTPRNVLSLGNGVDQMYDIKYNDGSYYTVNSEHILCLKYNNEIHHIAVKDYLNLHEDIRMKYKGYKVSVEFEEINITDPFDYAINLNNKMDNKYKINNKINRLKLFYGIVHKYGYIENNKYHIKCHNKILSDDIIFLCRSLGYNIINENNIIIIDINHILEYDIIVVKSRIDNYYGFTLDGNKRFLLGDFTVTHNTTLIKEGISKAMNKPFIFISLGGATDASFLDGHSYTYEGSMYGRIVSGLIANKCMNPIIYFDELDKISKTSKGDEITNILIHLTDPVQNSNFRDKYFHGIDIDLSKATMIFSFNNPVNINPILLDRITTIETKYLLIYEKIKIIKNYLIPNILSDIGLNKNDIDINDDTIKYIITKYTNEGGVRKIKSLIYYIIRELNLLNLMNKSINIDNNNITIKFPLTININIIKYLLKDKIEIQIDKIHNIPQIGMINGLYAGSYGIGGILPIQAVWIPISPPLSLKTTGYLKKIIKESTDVACSLAWNYLSDDLKNNYLNQWKDKSMGFHIHCTDSATPKDGPSAGTALTIILYSLLINKPIKNDIAITGEINLHGNITAIGGLEEKLEGAKKSGVKLVLIPKENNLDLNKIKNRNITLLDENFDVKCVETFNDAIKYVFD